MGLQSIDAGTTLSIFLERLWLTKVRKGLELKHLGQEKLLKNDLPRGLTKFRPPKISLLFGLDADTPVWAKGIIIGALGYFISPVDAIPDIVPVVGYTDDLGALAIALAAIAAHIKDEHVAKAKRLSKNSTLIFKKYFLSDLLPTSLAGNNRLEAGSDVI